MARIGGAAAAAARRAESDDDPDSPYRGGLQSHGSADVFDNYLEDFHDAARSPQEIFQSRFNMFVGVVIMANAVVIALETDQAEYTSITSEVWNYFENFFIAFFLLELLVRLYWERCRYFTSSWNLLDFTCISTSILDAWILRPMMNGSDSGLRMLSVLRILRLFRLVRLLRIFKMFHDLYTVVCAFGASLQSIMWVTVLLCLGLFFCAILTTQVLGQSPEFSEIEIGDDNTINDHFGTVGASMFSLFELLTMEGWTDVGRPLVNKSPWLLLFFIAFFMIFSFGLMSMIIGLVVDRTIQYSQTNDFVVEKEKRNQRRDVMESLKAFFIASDANGDGMLSLDELRTALKGNNEVREALERCDVPVEMWKDFFDILDKDKKGQVTVEQFLAGVDRLRGEARGKDMVATQIIISQIQNNQEVVLKYLNAMEAEQQEVLQRLYVVEDELRFGALSLKPCSLVETMPKFPSSSVTRSASSIEIDNSVGTKPEAEPEPAPCDADNPSMPMDSCPRANEAMHAEQEVEVSTPSGESKPGLKLQL